MKYIRNYSEGEYYIRCFGLSVWNKDTLHAILSDPGNVDSLIHICKYMYKTWLLAI